MPKNSLTIIKSKLNEYFIDGFECFQTSEYKDFIKSKYDTTTFYFEYGDGVVYFQHVREINQIIVALQKDKNTNAVYPFRCGNNEHKVKELITDNVCKIIMDAVHFGFDIDLIIENLSKAYWVSQELGDD